MGFDMDVDGLRARHPSVGWARLADWLSANRGLIVGAA